MATTNSVIDAYTIQFGKNWWMGVQQKVERLRRFVTVHEGCTGKARTHNRIEAEEMEEQTERLAKTQGTELTTTKRWVFPKPHQKTTYLDEWDADLLGETILPVGDATRVHKAASARKLDKIILDGMFGNNYEGGGTGTESGDLTARSKADVTANDIGGTTNMTLAMLIQAKGILGANETYGQDQHEAGEQLVLAVNQSTLDALLLLDELTSVDYAAVKALVAGEINSFMGMNFVRTEQLNANDNANGVYCQLWAKTHAHFDIWKDFSSKISVRDDLSEAFQIRSKLMAGACRDQDEAFVWIDNVQ